MKVIAKKLDDKYKVNRFSTYGAYEYGNPVAAGKEMEKALAVYEKAGAALVKAGASASKKAGSFLSPGLRATILEDVKDIQSKVRLKIEMIKS